MRTLIIKILKTLGLTLALITIFLMVCSGKEPPKKKDKSANWNVTHYNEENGLDYKTVSGLTVDNKGLIWLGNESGLKIFDGKTIFKAGNFLVDKKKLLDLPVNAVIFDSSRNSLIVIATKEQRTIFYTLDLGKLYSHQDVLQEILFLNGSLNCTPSYFKNKLLCIVDNRVNVVFFENGKVKKQLTNRGILAVGLYCINDSEFYAITTTLDSIYKLNVTNDSLYADFTEKISLYDYYTVTNDKGFYNTKKGKLYLNTNQSLMQQKGHVAFDAGLTGEFTVVEGLIEDKFQNYYLYGKSRFQKIEKYLPIINGFYDKREMRAILFNKKNSNYYIGTSKGIIKFDLGKKSFSKLSIPIDSGYWFSGHQQNDSLLTFYGNNTIKSVLFLNKNSDAKRSIELKRKLSIWCVLKDEESEDVYLGTDRGIFIGKYSNDLKSIEFKKINALLSHDINAILRYDKNNLIAAAKSGLYLVDLRTHQLKTIKNGSFYCLEKSQDKIIAGSATNGAYIFDKKLNLLKEINTSSGLKSNTIYSLIWDKGLNTLWLGTAYGLTVFHYPTGICKTYTTKDGLTNNEFNRNSVYFAEGDSLLIMGCVSGLNLIKNRLPFELNNRIVPKPTCWAYEARYPDNKIQKELIGAQIAMLKPNINQLTIKTVNDYGDLILITAYKLDNEVWKYVKAGEDIEVLSPRNGKHIMLVKTLLANGKQSEIVRLNFEIEREWYLKPWGIIFIAFSFFMLLFPIVYIRDYFLRQKHDKQINKNKEKLFSIIAHDLRSPIKTYQGLAEIINYLIEKKDWESIKQVSENIDQTGQKLDLMLENLLNWSLLEQKEIKPIKQLCNVAEISMNIVELYKVIAGQKNITIIHSHGEHVELFSDANLLKLIFRNIVDNAVKNAREYSEIEFFVSIKNEMLTIKICNQYHKNKSAEVENFVINIFEPNKTQSRGIGHKFIVQSLRLLNGYINATLNHEEQKLCITIIIPNLK